MKIYVTLVEGTDGALCATAMLAKVQAWLESAVKTVSRSRPLQRVPF